MMKVYGDRERALRKKKEEEEIYRKEREVEGRLEAVRRREFEEQVKKEELNEKLRMKQHQNTILWQINEKREKERMEMLEKMEEERQRRLKELEYEMRIQQEKERGRILLEKTKSHRLF